MATTVVEVNSSAFTAVVAGPLDAYVQNNSKIEVIYRVATTGAQNIDADHHVLDSYSIHPVRIPTGSSLYARVREKASSRSAKISYSEAFLGPEE